MLAERPDAEPQQFAETGFTLAALEPGSRVACTTPSRRRRTSSCWPANASCRSRSARGGSAGRIAGRSFPGSSDMRALVVEPGVPHSARIEAVDEPAGDGVRLRVLEVGVCAPTGRCRRGCSVPPPREPTGSSSGTSRWPRSPKTATNLRRAISSARPFGARADTASRAAKVRPTPA